MRPLLITSIFIALSLSCTPRVPSNGDTPSNSSEVHEVALAQDVKWTTSRGFDLTMDIYTPQTARANYPVIIMYHGGGWLINDNSIMDEGAAYLAAHGEYVVCNVNYRLLGDLENSVTMDEIVQDALGAVLWVKENIANYQGDPNRLITTGDSAGGHLAVMAATQGHRVAATGSYGAPDFNFVPSYIPTSGLPVGGVEVDVAIISYGAFDLYEDAVNRGFETPQNVFWMLGGAAARGIFGAEVNATDNPAYYQMVSPAYLIEPATERNYPPMLFTVGSEDDLTTPASIQAYMSLLTEKGHEELEYWEHEGRPHAFLDSGSNAFLGIEFTRDAIPALEYMLGYLNGHFY